MPESFPFLNQESSMHMNRAIEQGPASTRRSAERAMKLPERAEKSSIELDMKKIHEGDTFHGSTGDYTFVRAPDANLGFLESRVRDQKGKEFFLHTKEPERQALASCIGQHVIQRHPEFAALRFPEIRLETVNGNPIAFMEYFDNFEEVTEKNTLSTDEKAFLVVFNLWMGNWDFKEDHVLTSKKRSHEFGLIDLEKCFDFDDRERLSNTAERVPFLGEISDADCKKYIEFISTFDESDEKVLVQKAADAGIDPREAQSAIEMLIRREPLLIDELETVRTRYEQLQKIAALEIGEAA